MDDSTSDEEISADEIVELIERAIDNSDHEVEDREQAIEDALLATPVVSHLDSYKGDESTTGTIYIKLMLGSVVTRIKEKYQMVDKYKSEEIDKVKLSSEVNDLPNDLLIFFTLASGFIEEICGDIIEQEMISDKYKGTNKTEKLIENNLSQPTKEEIILRSGTIKEEVKGWIEQTRRTRNSLVHDLYRHYELMEEDEAWKKMKNSAKALNQLNKIANNHKVLSIDRFENTSS